MASTFSTDLKLELMATGENSGTWGTKTNTNLDLVQQAIVGFENIAITSTNTTLVMTDATISNARNAVLKFTGTITANCTVFVASGIEKTYIIENGTSGAFTLALNQVGGNSVIFGATDKTSKIVYLDGTNANDLGLVNLTAPQTLTNKTLTSPTINTATLTSPIIDIIDDANGNEEIKFTTTASAVNELTVANAATGNAPEISSTGDDTNIDIKITPKGTGKVVLDGIKYPNSDGSAGQVISTDGSGNLSFTTISSSPEQLVKSAILEANASVSAGKLTSIGSTGVVVSLPVINTFGTTFTNTLTSTYSTVGLDGSTIIHSAQSLNTSTAKSVNYFGKLISNSANPTNGTVLVTSSFTTPVGASQLGPTIIPTAVDKYLTFFAGIYAAPGGECQPFFRGNRGIINQLTVSTTSGNMLIGPSLTTLSSSDTQPGAAPNPLSALNFDKISNNIIYYRYQDSLVNVSGFVTVAGSTCTLTSDTDANAFAGANGIGSILTTNNIIGFGTAGTWKTAAYTSSPQGIGTVTTTTQVSDYNANGSWGKFSPYLTDSAPHMITTYQNTSAINRYITYSVNSTTGALTAVSSGLLTDLNSMTAGSLVFADSNNAVGPTGSLAFSGGVLTGRNTPYTLGSSIRANTTNLFFSFGSTFATSFPTNTGYTANAFGTNLFNYFGVAKTNDSTSPVDVVTDGVAGGFSGLTAGTLYFATSPADGNVTTDTTSGLLIGKAISATEILLQRSNAQ